MTIRDILEVSCGRVQANFVDPDADVSFSMCGDAMQILQAREGDFFLRREVMNQTSTDYCLVINAVIGDAS